MNNTDNKTEDIYFDFKNNSLQLGFYAKYLKRFFDIVISGIALIVLSPLILLLSVLVRINMGSPVIFKQARPGKNEIVFDCYKFRTMTDEKDENGELLEEAKRLTKFGIFLRRTSLDELPELWNIFTGKMSIIGPRPLLVKYLPYYIGEEHLRHSVRPGLTGLAQVSGRNYLQWDQRFETDVYYVKNLTFLMDCKVFFLTIKSVFCRENIAIDPNQVETKLEVVRADKKQSPIK